jgi:hypothetical protein
MQIKNAVALMTGAIAESAGRSLNTCSTVALGACTAPHAIRDRLRH